MIYYIFGRPRYELSGSLFTLKVGLLIATGLINILATKYSLGVKKKRRRKTTACVT